ncbi:MAG: hypothetical protein KDC71_14635 [Acidobacteria bacterium]|nr:hypothetical protein [Acidobacteriota bacterium]
MILYLLTSLWLQASLADLAPPDGFVLQAEGAYAQYLLNLKLLPAGSPVHLYDGRLKGNQRAHFRVLDLEIGQKNLVQCADAAILLRARFLYQHTLPVVFHATNGQALEWSRYAQGERLQLRNQKLHWVATSSPNHGPETFWRYMEQVFSYAGSMSLAFDTKPVPQSDIRAGDLIVQPGSPGHVITILAVAENGSGEKQVLLAQSYMPAQQIHILCAQHDQHKAWTKWPASGPIDTPEWSFHAPQILRWTE